MKFSTKQWLLLPVFILICYTVAYAGAFFEPGAWYEDLKRAPWSPPNIAFPIVWGILYLFIAISGWLIFNYEITKLKALWVIQLILNAAWSWVFFGQHWVAFALIDLLLIVTTVSILIVLCWRHQLKISAFLLIPYLLWLSIATSLNTYIFIAN